MNLTVRYRWPMLAMFLCSMMAGCRPAASAPTRTPPKVTVAHPVFRPLTDEDDYNGWLQAWKSVEVRSQVSGQIKTDGIHFKDGDLVSQGKLLFELDPRPFQVQIDRAEAEARALDAQKKAAEQDIIRYTELVKTGGATKQQLEKAKADTASYDAQIAAKKEEAAKHKLDLEFSRITAPIDGRISRTQFSEGNLVNAGGSAPYLTTIKSVTPIFVYFNMDERSLQGYRASHAGEADATKPLRELHIPFRFGLDSDNGYPRSGTIDFLDNEVDAKTGTISVRGVVKNEDGRLVPGERVRVRMAVSGKYEATLVPDTAVNTDQKEKYLLLVGADNIVTRENVDQGRLLDDGMRVILKPKLKADAWIIVEGMERARLKEAVEPVPESAPAAKTSAK